MRMPGSLAPLRSVTYRRFFVGQLTSAFGDGMVAVALAFAVLDVTGSSAALGWVLGTRTAFTIAALLLGGVVADRFSQRPVMLAAGAVICLVIPFLGPVRRLEATRPPAEGLTSP